MGIRWQNEYPLGWCKGNNMWHSRNTEPHMQKNTQCWLCVELLSYHFLARVPVSMPVLFFHSKMPRRWGLSHSPLVSPAPGSASMLRKGSLSVWWVYERLNRWMKLFNLQMLLFSHGERWNYKHPTHGLVVRILLCWYLQSTWTIFGKF